jgi:hypothetical protein
MCVWAACMTCAAAACCVIWSRNLDTVERLQLQPQLTLLPSIRVAASTLDVQLGIKSPPRETAYTGLWCAFPLSLFQFSLCLCAQALLAIVLSLRGAIPCVQLATLPCPMACSWTGTGWAAAVGTAKLSVQALCPVHRS